VVGVVPEVIPSWASWLMARIAVTQLIEVRETLRAPGGAPRSRSRAWRRVRNRAICQRVTGIRGVLGRRGPAGHPHRRQTADRPRPCRAGPPRSVNCAAASGTSTPSNGAVRVRKRAICQRVTVPSGRTGRCRPRSSHPTWATQSMSSAWTLDAPRRRSPEVGTSPGTAGPPPSRRSVKKIDRRPIVDRNDRPVRTTSFRHPRAVPVIVTSATEPDG
jgi:hypothetical protein